MYVDMSDSPEIFECEGDYQFEIYRMMRDMNGYAQPTSLVLCSIQHAKICDQSFYIRPFNIICAFLVRIRALSNV